MANPLRSEAAAYRFLLLTIGYFALIVAATLIFGTWVGLAVFAVLSAVCPLAPVPGAARAARAHLGRRSSRRGRAPDTRRRQRDRRRCAAGRGDPPARRGRRRARARRLARRSTRRSSTGSPTRTAPVPPPQERLQESLVRLRALGVNAEGEVGDADPLQAIEDALRTFGADEIIISTHPEGRSNWLERGVVDAARERFTPPVTHVVVDLAAERDEVRELRRRWPTCRARSRRSARRP